MDNSDKNFKKRWEFEDKFRNSLEKSTEVFEQKFKKWQELRTKVFETTNWNSEF